ncbi:sensor domain-containing diguanylate cyclase [Roseateles sp. BYS96W]|uniref:diguanylate cyclase n=1 Tax=Pelomonas nitida TaxID=3299027 RepID=A0ABW7G6P3_9BURK
MDFLDVPTILQISAVFNLMAALAWLTLAQVFHIAPRAGRLMAGGHVLRFATQGYSDVMSAWPAALQQAVLELGLLGCILMLLLALRRMLLSRQRPRDLAWIGGLGAAGIAAGLAAGSAQAAELAGTVAVTLLGGLAVRAMLLGLRGQVAPVTAGFATLPFAMLALMAFVHSVELLLEPDWAGHAVRGDLPSPARAVLWYVVTFGITLSLIALMIWRVVARIQHLTYRDPLTGALNRRAFERALGDAQAQLLRGHGFALVMIDIDHFKRVNDQHGHAAGDAALRHCVGIWQAGLREVDCLGRLGGEEFCALLPLASPGDLAAAVAVAERLRADLQARPLPWENGLLPLSASFGVALPAAGDARGEVGLVRADAELYRAKAEGRNRVCAATHLQPAEVP